MKIPHVHRRDVSGGGGAELGVFPAFLWAKHAAWLALERHTRRVKHSALSWLKAWEMELAETTVQTTGSLHVNYADIPLTVNRLCNIQTSTVLHLIQEFNNTNWNALETQSKQQIHGLHKHVELVIVRVTQSYIMWLSQWTERHSETTEEVLDPVTSFWVYSRCFLWSEVSNNTLTSVSGFCPRPLTPFHQSIDLNVDVTPVSTSRDLTGPWHCQQGKHNKDTKRGRALRKQHSYSLQFVLLNLRSLYVQEN